VLPLSWLIVIVSPLGVLVALILVSPSGVVLLEGYFLLVLGFYCFSFPLFSWHYSVNGIDVPYSSVKNFESVEWERVEQN
jgi:hypothetical protein